MGGTSELQAEVLFEEQGSESHTGLPILQDLHWDDEPPKYLALKTSRAYAGEIQRIVGTRDSAIEGLAHKLTVSSPGIYAVTCKAPQSYEMEIHWLLLGHMLDLVDTGI